MNQLFIPEKIKIGYQKRNDTYTKKLGYIIYYDSKGVLRKETSWKQWKDDAIDEDNFENEPQEGFLLNRNGGGVKESYGWNARHEFVRVFDPRGFEFEISIANLLYILQETNSIKGKGLEGEFVYAWQGTTLCLLPVKSEEYKKCKIFTALQSKKVLASELKPGYVYQTNKQEKLIYMGKFKWTNIYVDYKARDPKTNEYPYRSESKLKQIFIVDDPKLENISIRPLSSITNISEAITSYPVHNFDHLIAELEKVKQMNDIHNLVHRPAEIKMRKDVDPIYKQHYADRCFDIVADGSLYKFDKDTGYYTRYMVQASYQWDYGKDPGGYVLNGYTLTKHKKVRLTLDNLPIEVDLPQDYSRRDPKVYSLEEIKGMNFLSVFVEMCSGILFPFDQFV